MQISFKINGNPVGQARPKFFRRGKHVGAYNPQETEAAKFWLLCRSQIEKHALPVFKKGEALFLRAEFYFKRPASHYGTGKNEGRLKQSSPVDHTIKPDLDNLVKFVKDAIKDVWHDDSQVIRTSSSKDWWSEGYTNVTISNKAD